VIEGNFTWDAAKADAESRGGHLATFTSVTEWNNYLQTYSPSFANGLRIGYEAETGSLNDWVWVTKENGNFSFWDWGQPDRPRGNGEDSVVMYSATLGYVWHDYYKNVDVYGYLLELGYPTDPFKADTDGDGYNDKVESDVGTDPNNPASYPVPPDTDGDGIPDAYETNTGVYVSPTDTGTDPNKVDTDGDGLTDGVETATFIYIDASDTGTDPNVVDSDADGLSDGVETNTGVYVGEGNTGTSPVDEDTSNDGISDGEAVLWKFNPHIDCTPMMNFLRFASETGTSGRFGLFTSNSITDLNLGGLVLQKSGSSVFLRLQLQTKAAMSQSWSNHSVVPMFLDMPGNKAFMRVRALGPQ